MDSLAVLSAFDEQIRRGVTAGPPGRGVETDDHVTRVVSPDDGWNAVTWSGLGADTADAAITAQLRRFADLPGPWEWKHYSHDEPADLPERLVRAGFVPEPPEALLVAEIGELDLEVELAPGVELVPVEDEAGVQAMVAAHDLAFGGDSSALGRHVLAALAQQPRTIEAVVAMAGDSPVCAGRLELHPGTEFASIWGGGTAPGWRGQGVFRAVVAHRAARAAAHGYRFLQVDATDASQPILERLGFLVLATTTPFVHPGR